MCSGAFVGDFGYEAVTFRSMSEDGRPVYHTNVIMCVASEFALIGLEMIADEAERMGVQNLLEATGKEVIELSAGQIEEFAGNAIELHNEREKLLVLSERAAAALSNDQRSRIERLCPSPAARAAHDRAGRRKRPLHDRDHSSPAALMARK